MKELLKKIAGPIGVKIFRETRWRAKSTFYSFSGFFSQFYECVWLSRGRYAPHHSDNKFHKKYYSQKSSDKERTTSKEGFVMMLDGRMFHGGLTDRLRGILTTYEFLKGSGKPFYIYWTNPFPLENYLIPASFDWRIDPQDLTYESDKAFPFIIEDEPDYLSRWRMKIGLKQWRPQIHVYSNADNSRGNYSRLYHELFKPSSLLQESTQSHLSILGPRYQAFTFRFLQLLGDFKDWNKDILPPGEDIAFMENVKEEFLKLIKDIPQDERILVTSDSKRFLDYIFHVDPRIYVVPGDVKNIDLTQGLHPEAWLKTFTDQQLLMHAYRVTLMRTGGMFRSGFPRFAAEIGNAEFIDHKF